MKRSELAQLIDHTLLRPEATAADVARHVAVARRLGVWAVCLSPSLIPLGDAVTSGHAVKVSALGPDPLARSAAAGPAEPQQGSECLDQLGRGGLKVAVVAGFPSGAHYPEVKAAEAARARADGADELDMMTNLRWIVEGDWARVSQDVIAVRAAFPRPLVLKVILETAALTDRMIVRAAEAAAEAGADFVKTSTGFHPAGGATVEAVKLLAQAVGPAVGVKASGGIRTTDQALAMVRAGATRLGLSATEQVLAGLPE
ncbi:MAG: deoxyribose-phosphate aldolase [Bifidobacteriaceae bacterium]|jgi:deoxyribose-phosphate aldolase|nr:deoxyribose-phosphate aldolase [Bifidobacteriaceae bacterium]